MGGECLGKNVETPKPPFIPICDTCQVLIDKYGTNEYVSPWYCTCDPKKITALNQQLKFSAGKYVGRHFRFAWQGAPKGAKVKYRPNK